MCWTAPTTQSLICRTSTTRDVRAGRRSPSGLVGLSTHDNEELTISTATGSNNPQGWYYVEVFGKTFHDLGYYLIEATLNP